MTSHIGSRTGWEAAEAGQGHALLDCRTVRAQHDEDQDNIEDGLDAKSACSRLRTTSGRARGIDRWRGDGTSHAVALCGVVPHRGCQQADRFLALSGSETKVSEGGPSPFRCRFPITALYLSQTGTGTWNLKGSATTGRHTAPTRWLTSERVLPPAGVVPF